MLKKKNVNYKSKYALMESFLTNFPPICDMA